MPDWQEEMWEMSEGEHVPLAFSDLEFDQEISSFNPQEASMQSHDTVSDPNLIDVPEAANLNEVTCNSSNASDGSLSKLESFIDDSFKGFVKAVQSNTRFQKLNQYREKFLKTLKNSIHHTKEVPEHEQLSVIRQTRSRGPVPLYPNVQPKILERVSSVTSQN